MTIPTPFTGGFPFNQNPFRSRVESQIDTSKNYYAVAFKPGYPLQASELNEMQEIFYVQNTLTTSLINSSTGWTAGTVPFSGCTPLTPRGLITATGTTSITATGGIGWYLIKSTAVNGGLGVWTYNSSDKTIMSGFTGATGTTGSYGIVVKPVTIACTTNIPAGTTQDRTLQDSNNMNIINGPCGADRLKLDIIKFGYTAASGEYLVPIFTGFKNGNTGTTCSIVYLNGVTIYGLT
jgi:hypothetical protein